jgi:hypothetical protein
MSAAQKAKQSASGKAGGLPPAPGALLSARPQESPGTLAATAHGVATPPVAFGPVYHGEPSPLPLPPTSKGDRREPLPKAGFPQTPLPGEALPGALPESTLPGAGSRRPPAPDVTRHDVASASNPPFEPPVFPAAHPPQFGPIYTGEPSALPRAPKPKRRGGRHAAEVEPDLPPPGTIRE